jgi:hypothetical protein
MADGGMPPEGAGEQAGNASRDGAADDGTVSGGPAGGGPADSPPASNGPADSAPADSAPADSGAASDGPGGGGLGAGTGRDGAVSGGASGGERAELLRDMKALRRRARSARHAYWFPLVLFGLLTCASIPFYRESFSFGNGPAGFAARAPQLSAFGTMPGIAQNGLAFYWLAALLAGLLLTLLWYRWHARRVGLRTPSRGFGATIVAVMVLAVVIPPLSVASSPHWLRFLHRLWPGDLVVRGTFPLLIIGAGLLVLAWAERSLSLTVIAVAYTGAALLASLYDIGNLTYRLGWTPPSSIYVLPNLLLPALVLLAAGAGAFVAQRRAGVMPARR